jgi:hypothetical protein
LGPAALRGRPGSIINKEYAFHRLLSDAEYDTVLFSASSQIRFVHQVGDVTTYPQIPFTPEPLYVTDHRNNVVFGTSDAAEVMLINTDGVRTHIYQWPVNGKPVEEVWDQYKEQMLSDLSEERRIQYKQFYDQDLPLPEQTPAISEIKVDHTNHIWVQRYRLPWEEANEWDVLNPDGQWLGKLDLPTGLRITDIGKDYLLGRIYEDGVEKVIMYGLNRGTESS